MATCAVVGPHCAAPAGVLISGVGYAPLPGQRLPRCYGCGEHVCTAASCSTQVGRSRLCLTCQAMNVRMYA